MLPVDDLEKAGAHIKILEYRVFEGKDDDISQTFIFIACFIWFLGSFTTGYFDITQKRNP